MTKRNILIPLLSLFIWYDGMHDHLIPLWILVILLMLVTAILTAYVLINYTQILKKIKSWHNQQI